MRSPRSAELVKDMRGGAVETLLMLGGNPVYDAPADLNFLDALKKVKLRAHVGLYSNETAAWCHWHVPEAHYLESWSDARAYDGTVSIVQPLIAPIYDGKTRARSDERPGQSSRPIGARNGPRLLAGPAQRRGFRRFLADLPARRRRGGNGVRREDATRGQDARAAAALRRGSKLCSGPIRRSATASMSNNAWLQEMPKPQNKMTWDNAVWISPKSAAQLWSHHRRHGRDRSSGAARWTARCGLCRAMRTNRMTVHFGYGRTRAGKVANGIGFNAYALRTSDALWHGAGVSITRKVGGYKFATTQHTQTMEERDPFRAATFAEYHQDPEFARPEEKRVARRHIDVSAVGIQQTQVGHVDRPQRVRRVPRLHDRLPVGKQHRGGRQGGSGQGPPHELDSRGSLLQRLRWTIRKCISSRCLACIARTLCASWCARWRRRCIAPKA